MAVGGLGRVGFARAKGVTILIRRLPFWMTANRTKPDIRLANWMMRFPGLIIGRSVGHLSRFGCDCSRRTLRYLMGTQDINVGDRVVIRLPCMLMADTDARIIVGDNMLIGAGVHAHVNDHSLDRLNETISNQGCCPEADAVIDNDVRVEVCASLVSRVNVSQHTGVAIGSIVINALRPFSLLGCIPARESFDLTQNKYSHSGEPSNTFVSEF